MTQTMQAPTSTGQPVYEITDEDKKRRQAIAEAWKAYDGEFEPQLEKTPEGIDPNVIINQCAPIVDTGVDFLFGQEVEISAEDAAPDTAQKLLDDAWGRKEVRIPLLQDLAYNGALARNAFLRIVPSTDDITQATTYRLVTVDPAIVAGVQTAPQDCETVLLYCLQYAVADKDELGKPCQMYYREEIMRIDPDGNAKQGKPDSDDTWQIQHWTQEVSSAQMEPKNNNWLPAGEPIQWNYPFPPIFHCKNLPRPNEFWGRADIRKDIIALNKSLNLDMSCVLLDMVLYGQPILYANGVGMGTIERKAGRIIELELLESKITAVAIPTDIPGALSVANDLRSSIDETSSVPGVATGRMSTIPHGNLPGVTVELLFMSLIKQTHKKRCLYGKLLIDVSKALLVLAGLANTVDDIDITLAWQDPLPHDDLPAVQAAIGKKEVGISDTTLQRELGYDPEEEQKLSQEEDAKKLQAVQDALPPGLPGTPLLPNQAPPAPPAAPGAPPAPQAGGKPA